MTGVPLRRAALAAWAVLLVGVAVAVLLPGRGGKLYPTFVAAGEHFWVGRPLYGWPPPDQDQFRYSPLAAAAFAPWTLVPAPAGPVLWRWLQAVAFLLTLRAWARTLEPAVPWPALALLCLPLVGGNVFNAQLNPLVAALMLAGVAAFSTGRYTWAAAAVAGAALFKVYPLALGLLLCVVEPRRFAPRLLAAVAAGCLLPFALQSEEYLTQQFADWVGRVGGDNRTHLPIHGGYYDFQKVLRRWGLPTPLAAYRLMEVAAGCAAAGFVLWGRRSGWTRDEQVQTCAALGLIWCTLFGPATESATYMLLAPLAAWAVVAVTGRPLAERIWVRGAYLLLVSMTVAVWFPRPVSDPYRALVPQAHGATLLLIWVVWRGRKAASTSADGLQGSNARKKGLACKGVMSKTPENGLQGDRGGVAMQTIRGVTGRPHP